MSYIKYFYGLVIVCALFGCEEYERTNILDKNWEGYEASLSTELSFSTYNLIDKNLQYPLRESYIGAGDRVWIYIRMINTGDLPIYGVRSEISCSSDLITITPPKNEYFIKFSHDRDEDFMEVGADAWGRIVNFRDHRHRLYTPNSGAYTLEFQVSEAANVGDIVTFTIKSTDEDGNEWTNLFDITLREG